MVDKLDPFPEQGFSAGRRSELAERVQVLLAASIAVKQQVLETQVDTIVRMAEVIVHSLQRAGKVLLCGNGGSAADAQHLAAELLVRLRPQVNRGGLPALALATDTSSLTACSNDFGFEEYYERMARVLGRPGDVLIGITTSGRSPSVVRALRVAREQGLVTLGLLGGDGGDALAECDVALVVSSTAVGRVQETHIAVGHALIELVEDLLLESGYLRCT